MLSSAPLFYLFNVLMSGLAELTGNWEIGLHLSLGNFRAWSYHCGWQKCRRWCSELSFFIWDWRWWKEENLDHLQMSWSEAAALRRGCEGIKESGLERAGSRDIRLYFWWLVMAPFWNQTLFGFKLEYFGFHHKGKDRTCKTVLSSDPFVQMPMEKSGTHKHILRSGSALLTNFV